MKRKPRYKYERLQAQLHDQKSMQAARWIMLAIAILAGALCYVRLTSGTERHRANVTSLRRDLGVRTRELENLRMQQETLTSGRYVRNAIHRMGLNLQQAQEGQVRRMVLARDVPGRSKGRSLMAVSE